MKRWYFYGLIGLVFGIFDWFFIKWLSQGLGPNLGENPIIIIPIILTLNYGIWLLPIIPVVIYETRHAAKIKGPILAGIFTWCCAIFSYYVYYGTLLSLGKLIHMEKLNLFGPRYDGFWGDYWHMFKRIILSQFLEWIPIAVIGGGITGAIAWWIFHKRPQEENEYQLE